MRFSAIVLAALFVAPTARAADVKMPGLTFTAPGGLAWTQAGKGNVLTYTFQTKRGDQKAAAIIQINTSPNYSGDFDADFEKLANAIDALKGQKPLVERKGMTTSGWPARMALKCCSAGDLSINFTVVAFRTPGSFVAAEMGLIEVDDKTRDEARDAFNALVASFDFAGHGKLPVIPMATPGDLALAGLYTHSEGTLQMNGLGGTDYVVNTTTYFFQPDGLFASEPPSGTTDLKTFCAVKNEGCGAYRVSGGRLTRDTVGDKFGIVEHEEAPIAVKGADLEIDGAPYVKIAPLQDLKMDGTWTHFYGAAGTVGGTSTSVASVRTLVFTPDGRFKRSGFAGASSTSDSGGVTAGHERPEEAGSYAINDYTLTLTPDGGKAETLSFYLPDAGDQDLLMIDGSSYLREGREK